MNLEKSIVSKSDEEMAADLAEEFYDTYGNPEVHQLTDFALDCMLAERSRKEPTDEVQGLIDALNIILRQKAIVGPNKLSDLAEKALKAFEQKWSGK